MNIYKMLMAIMRVIRLSRGIMRISYRVRHQSSRKRFRHKNRAVWGLTALVVLMGFSSCDDYQPADNAIHVGYILCENHSCMNPETYFSQTTHKAVGVVFAEQTEDHPLMAVMLKELNEVFCDSVGLSNGTSGNLTAFDGSANTRAMQKSYNAGTKKGSPLAMKLFTFHEGGQSDFLPSVAEQRLLNVSARSINAIIERLGGTPIALDGDCWYWNSTEVSENSGLQAWLCSSANGGIIETPKTESHKARAIVKIKYSN